TARTQAPAWIKRDRREGRGQASLAGLRSSMAMSLNSLASKMSPHSRHSTNSASSSRATICTRGCLHSGMSLLFSGSWDCGIEFINSGCFLVRADQGYVLPEFVRYCRPANLDVKSYNLIFDRNYG